MPIPLPIQLPIPHIAPVPAHLALGSFAVAPPQTGGYPAQLERAVDALAAGRGQDAGDALRVALLLRHDDPTGRVVLATYYLLGGQFDRAAHEFTLLQTQLPDDATVLYGLALAMASRSRGQSLANVSAVSALTNLPALADTRMYLRLLYGGKAGLAQAVRETGSVREDEPNQFRLQIAGHAALRMGNMVRGERLLQTLLRRSGGNRLADASTLSLSFLPEQPFVGGTRIAAPLHLPQSTGKPLAGVVVVSPGKGLPDGLRFVLYTVDGGAWSASTNTPPYTQDWDTRDLPNGTHILRVRAVDEHDTVVRESERVIRLQNPNAPPVAVSASDSEEAAQIRARCLALLTPLPCRKAALYALAQVAQKRGDKARAISLLETVVAIDPTYGNAYATVRQRNLAMQGAKPGVWCAATTEKIVALTYDDGPNPILARTPALLNALQANHAKVTFFVVGTQGERSPDLLRRMVREGHEIANHSYTHPNLTRLPMADVQRELSRATVVIRDVTGRHPRFYRPPGGNYNAAVIQTAQGLGMAGAYWTLNALPYERAPANANDLSRYVVGHVRPGAIVLMHNAPPNTVAAVPAIVRGLRAKGYTLVTMSELMRRAKGKAVTAAPKKPGYAGRE